jgi:hypothetical protein
MSVKTPHHVFGEPLSNGGVTVCWSIDQTSQAAGGADNGYLDCARSHTPGYSSHGTTVQCVTNLSNCLGTGPGIANIVGHGNDGLIITGEGQQAGDPDKFIASWDQNIWGPVVAALKGKVGGIKLCGCHTGTGPEGASLLYGMMNETNATIMGPTGFLYCGGRGFWLEPNATWQISSPGRPMPTPIDAPTPHFVMRADEWGLQMKDSKRVELESVETLEVRRGRNVLLSLAGNAARSFAQLIDFANPIEINAVVGAVVTGELSIKVSGQEEVAFWIYNNRLLQRKDQPSLYYRCSEGFRAALTVGIR